MTTTTADDGRVGRAALLSLVFVNGVATALMQGFGASQRTARRVRDLMNLEKWDFHVETRRESRSRT